MQTGVKSCVPYLELCTLFRAVLPYLELCTLFTVPYLLYSQICLVQSNQSNLY